MPRVSTWCALARIASLACDVVGTRPFSRSTRDGSRSSHGRRPGPLAALRRVRCSPARATKPMTAAFDIVVPMFALMLCGYLAVHFRILGADGIRGLSNFVFFFAIPALLFRGIATSRGAEHDEIAIVYAYFIACLVLFAATMAAGRLVFRLRLQEQAIMAFT